MRRSTRRLPSPTYHDAVEEALCFGWIDRKINPIDDAFYLQVFTPRKRGSACSGVEQELRRTNAGAGQMTSAGHSAGQAGEGLGD